MTAEEIEISDSWTPVSYPIPNHWVYTELETVFDNLSLTGKKLAQKNYEANGAFPVVDQGISEIGGYSNDENRLIRLERPAIVFGDHTKCLKFISFSFVPGADGVKVLVPRNPVDPKYAFYACRSLRLPSRGYSRHYSFLKRCNFPLPPHNEQKRIVAKVEELFSELDNGIAALKTAREQLKVYRQAVLKHAFEGKLTAQWREENQDKLESPEQLLACIQRERDARYQQQLEDWKAAVKAWESKGKEGKKPRKPKEPDIYNSVSINEEASKLPIGWMWVSLGELITRIDQGWSPKCENVEADINEWGVIKTTAVQHGKFLEHENKVLPEYLEPRKQHELISGDILITRAGPRIRVGVCCLVKKVRSKLINCDKVYRIRGFDSICLPEFLEAVLNSPSTLDVLEGVKSGINDSGLNLNQKAFLSMLIPFCSLSEQKEIISKIEASLSIINKQQEILEMALRQSETLRQSILKKAFSGQLVPQDPNDEPASELLARIKAEKAAQKASKQASKPSKKPAAKRGRKPREAV